MNLQNSQLLRQQAYIGGAWCDADNGATITVRNPFDASVLGAVPNLGQAETARAIAAADDALPAWRARTGKERGAILRKWHALIEAHADDLALLLTLEQGKPLAEARGELNYALSFVEWFAEEAKRVYGDVLPHTRGDQRMLAIRQPVGVCAAIIAWNFPSALVTRKVSPALAAGCTVVLKPSELTPFTALALAWLGEQAGIPPGVLNVVIGDPAPIGTELTQNPTVRKLTFTGSTQTGRLLMQQSASNIKKLSLELGGNAPFIVFEDADLDEAVQGLVQSKFRNAGQTCVCANRVYVHASVADAFNDRWPAWWTTPRRAARASWRAASCASRARCCMSRPCWPASRMPWNWRTKRSSARWWASVPSNPKPPCWRAPTIAPRAWPPISTPPTWSGSGA
jgi:succinate-semialdehyde dehydrogenase/glutarate-semialdehyde dehydrogenase